MKNSLDSHSELFQQLTPFLRTKLGENISISGDIKRLQGGFDTDTFALTILNAPAEFPSDLVLRLFRHPHEASRVVRESTVQNAAASGGHAVPRVPIDSTGEMLINRPFFLMERLPGTSMGETILSHPEIIPIFPEMMAKLQAGLHRLDPTKLMHHLANSGVEINHMKPTRMLGSITAIADAAQAVDLIEINEWLTNNYPKQPEILAICHGDLHPNNILIHDGKVSGLIDWATTMFTHPEYDIAVTKTILSIGPPEDVGIPKAELDKMLGMALADYMAQCHELQDLDEALIDYYAVLRVGHAYAKVIGKRHGVDLPYVAHDGYAWDRPDLFAVVTRIIGETTGIDLVSA